MADNEHDEEQRRRRPAGATGGSPALADEGDVAFGAMAGTAVLIALLVAVFLPQLGIIGGDTGADKSHDGDKTEEVVEEETAAETTTWPTLPVTPLTALAALWPRAPPAMAAADATAPAMKPSTPSSTAYCSSSSPVLAVMVPSALMLKLLSAHSQYSGSMPSGCLASGR